MSAHNNNMNSHTIQHQHPQHHHPQQQQPHHQRVISGSGGNNSYNSSNNIGFSNNSSATHSYSKGLVPNGSYTPTWAAQELEA